MMESNKILKRTRPSQEEEDSESDDNFLYDQPQVLMQHPATLRSSSPAKISEPTSCDWVSADSNQLCRSGIKKLRYSLDQIVCKNNIQDERDEELASLQNSLRRGIGEGGITKMIEDDENQWQAIQTSEVKPIEKDQELCGEKVDMENIADGSLFPEHEKTLQQYALVNERIATLHPGEEVFCNTGFGKLFTFPVQLKLTGNPSAMEKLVMRSSREELEELLKARTILDIYQAKQCPGPVMLWLLQLLSVCDNVMVAGMTFDILWSLMNSGQHLHSTDKPWCPTLREIATIFVNYDMSVLCIDSLGHLTNAVRLSREKMWMKHLRTIQRHGLNIQEGARLDSLLPQTVISQRYVKEDKVHLSWSQEKNDMEQPTLENQRGFLPYNLQHVIKIITQCLVTQHGNSCFSEKDLVSLTYMMCKVSLDKQILRYPLQNDFHHCLAALLNCMQDETWQIQVREMCQILSHCSDHHHNLVYLVRLMKTGTRRGKVMCSMLSKVYLEKLSGTHDGHEQDNTRDITEAKVSDLILMLDKIKRRHRTSSDYYQLHSLVTLIELAVGYDKELYKVADKDALARLVIMLRDMAGEIRESHKHLCRTQVKDLIIRIASELTYLEQTLTIKNAVLHTFIEH